MEREYLLNEKPVKALWSFALPILLGNLFQQFYTMADSMIVGRCVGEDALAAIGASYSLTNVFICIAIGGGLGASVLTSRHFGARRYSHMRLSISTTLLSFLVLSLLLAAGGFFFCRPLLILLNTPSNILGMAASYLRIYFLGLPFLFMYNVLSAQFNALGRSKIPFRLLVFSSIFNILLDIFLVDTLALGITGAAWATLTAQGLSVFLSLFLFLRELRSCPVPDEEEPLPLFQFKELASVSRVALPSIFQQSTVSIGAMLVQSVVNLFGSQVLAGYSAASRVESLCFVPMAALGSAMSSYTAQNLGANRKESIKRVREGYHTALRLAALFAVLLCLVTEIFCRPLIHSFLGNDGTPAALETGISYLSFIGFFFFLIGLKMITDGLLRGASDMKAFTIANLVNLTLRVVFASVMAPRFGPAMVWYAIPLGWLANFLISWREYRSGKWQKTQE